jgi:transcriptional regulator with XRE-family HTH domain
MIGEEIRRLAKLKVLNTQHAIANATGLSQSFIARLLTGKRPNLTADTLYALSDALGVTCEHWRKFLTPEPAKKKSSPSVKRGRGRPRKDGVA